MKKYFCKPSKRLVFFPSSEWPFFCITIPIHEFNDLLGAAKGLKVRDFINLKKIIFLLAIGPCVTMPSYAQNLRVSQKKLVQKKISDRRFDYKFDIYSKTAAYNEGEDEASLVLFGIQPQFKFKLTPEFTLNADIYLNLSAARIQSRYLNRQDENFVLNDLSMVYEPTNYTKFSLGALNQGHLNSPLLVTNIGFPGAAATLHYTTNDYSFGLKGQRTIPVSQSFDSDRTDKEELPYFQTQGVFGEFKPTYFLKVKGQVNYYSFSDLPSVVAFESKRLGNDVTGVEVGDSFFVYKFSGIAQSYEANLQYTRDLQQDFLVSIVENENTNDGNNRAQFLKTSLSYDFESVRLTPSLASFYTEPNATPAFYNYRLYGNNNREGFEYSLSADFKKLGFSVSAIFVDSKVINQTIFQDDLKSMQLVLEMLDVKF